MAIIDATELDLAYTATRISQLSDDGNGPNADIVTQAIDRADGIIKNALVPIYTESQIEADNGVKRICEAFAIYYLESRRGDAPAQVLSSYVDAQRMLRDLVQGTARLAAADEALPSMSRDTGRGVLTQSSMFDGLPTDRIEEIQ